MAKQKKEQEENNIDSIIAKYSGRVFLIGDDNPKLNLDVISTGSVGLDLALGIGGIPRKRITEIFGNPSAGKTTIILSTIAEAQKLGQKAAFIDAEYGLDLQYAKNIGVDISSLLIAQPEFGEEAFEIIGALAKSGQYSIIAVDSVAALVPKTELEGNFGDANMGLHARLMSQAMRKLVGIVAETNTALVFLNQIRMKIGVMFGNPETTTGGNALSFYSSVRIHVKKQSKPILDSSDQPYASTIEANVIKNKVAIPLKRATFDIVYGKGIDKTGEIFDLALLHGIIDKSGSWYSYNSNRIGQGKINACEFLCGDGNVYLEQIVSDVKEKIKA